MKFNILSTSGHARRGELDFPRGKVQTPAFMPVGTNGTVKAMEVENLQQTGSEIILGNTYHLMLRPGDELIKNLGVEPLEESNLGEHLYALSRNRNTAVKNYIMNSNIVVGVGNIYASESLFRSDISPIRSSNRISEDRYKRLSKEIKKVLNEAIEMGGTTLRDFTYYNEVRQVGYFKQKLFVYGKPGEDCRKCGQKIKQRMIAGRNSFYCSKCQT